MTKRVSTEFRQRASAAFNAVANLIPAWQAELSPDELANVRKALSLGAVLVAEIGSDQRIAFSLVDGEHRSRVSEVKMATLETMQ